MFIGRLFIQRVLLFCLHNTRNVNEMFRVYYKLAYEIEHNT